MVLLVFSDKIESIGSNSSRKNNPEFYTQKLYPLKLFSKFTEKMVHDSLVFGHKAHFTRNWLLTSSILPKISQEFV